MNPILAKASYETLRNTLSGLTYGPIIEVPRAEQCDMVSYVGPDRKALLIHLDEKALLARDNGKGEQLHVKVSRASMDVASALRAYFVGKDINCNSGLYRRNAHGEQDLRPYLAITCSKSLAPQLETLLEQARYGEDFVERPYTPDYNEAQKQRVAYIAQRLAGRVSGPCSIVPNDQARIYEDRLGADEAFLIVNLDGKSLLRQKWPWMHDPGEQRRRVGYYVDDIGRDIHELLIQLFPNTHIGRAYGFHQYTTQNQQVDDVHQPYIGFRCHKEYAPHIQSVVEGLIEQGRVLTAQPGRGR